jgi:Mn-containing catalase
MAKAASFDHLRELFDQHLSETEEQIERLNECFSLLGETARAKPCDGMMGLVEEGQEVMEEGEEKEDAAADLALIGAAQRVEHYEISRYATAKNSHSNFAKAPWSNSSPNPLPKKKTRTNF